jgi:hypothetical protein
VSVSRPLPRFVIAKSLKDGSTGYYWNLPSYYRKLGCTLHKDHATSLGNNYDIACGESGKANVLNKLFDEWDHRRLGGVESPVAERLAPFGSVEWLFRTYKASNDWEAKVSARTAPDHELTIKLLCDIKTKKATASETASCAASRRSQPTNSTLSSAIRRRERGRPLGRVLPLKWWQ